MNWARRVAKKGGGAGEHARIDFSPTRNAPVAQLDRASGYEPEGRTFESCRAHHKPQII